MYYFYKIVCDDVPDYAYVGSTRSLRHRKCQHKSNCNNENCKMYNYKLYKTIRETGGWDNWRMVCIHQEEYSDKRSAEIKEEELRVALNANMNSQKCHITQDERTEQKRELNKTYYEKNKDYYTEYHKEYREQNYEQIKEYREKNKERTKEYDKEYREQNKDKINERQNKKFDCDCGGKYTYAHKSQHLKSKKHQNYLKENVNK
jgi:hypothetical protein